LLIVILKKFTSMSKFLDLFRSFPDWSHVDDALGDAITHESKAGQFYQRAQGTPFREYYRRQPDALSQLLNDLQSKINVIHEADASEAQALGVVRSDLERIKALHAGISTKRKDVERLTEQSNKSGKAVEAAQAKLNQMQGQGESPQLVGARDTLEMCTRQYDAHVQLRDAKAEELRGDEEKYKAELFGLALASFKKFAIDRLEKVRGLSGVSDEIEDIAAKIDYPTDTSIDALRTELQALDTEATGLPE
jgi:chromosome segregation ATPase